MEICEVGCSEQYKSKPIAVFSKVPIYVITENIDTSKSFFSYTSLFKQSWSLAMGNLKRMPCLFSSVLQKWGQNICCKNVMADVESLETLNLSCVTCYRQPLSCVLLVENKKNEKKTFVWCFLLLENIRKKWNVHFFLEVKKRKKKLNVWCFLLVEENKKQNKKTQMKCLVFLVSRKKKKVTK